MRRVLFSPSWLARHALALFMIGLFARLGWWQWEKGQSSRGTLQNLFYGIEWPIFAAAVVFGWWQMIREELHPSPEKEITPARPPAGIGQYDTAVRNSDSGVSDSDSDSDKEGEEELASYNRYLASLYERDTPSGSGKR